MHFSISSIKLIRFIEILTAAPIFSTLQYPIYPLSNQLKIIRVENRSRFYSDIFSNFLLVLPPPIITEPETQEKTNRMTTEPKQYHFRVAFLDLSYRFKKSAKIGFFGSTKKCPTFFQPIRFALVLYRCSSNRTQEKTCSKSANLRKTVAKDKLFSSEMSEALRKCLKTGGYRK